jgi:hypothetical protein
MTQTSDTPYRNNNLFSNYYLEKYLPESPEWKKEDHIAVFKQIKNIYTRESSSIKTLNEKQLENHFFNEIFSILGFVYEVTEPTHARNFPDYAFFFDRNGLDDAHKNKETISFFANAVAIGEVKQWKVDLDKVSKNEYNISENPSLQIWTYLEDTEQKWGILSNGRIWRLYCKERRRDNYLEINLSRLIESNDIEAFRFFYYFFRKDAFVKSKEGQAFLDRVLNESQDYAQKIGDDLKDNVYWAMKRIADGFVNQKSNHLDSRDPATLARVQNNTMILLYRFLFLLYAEGKGLLDLRDQRYREYYSFHHIKHNIAETQDGPAHQRFDTVKSSIQGDLKVLFKLVDEGSESFGIPKTEYYIPAYNGGLFDPEKHPDLEHWEIGDKYLADAIDLLSRSKLKEGQRDFVDYSTLEIRNLGSIYEGLLEYKLRVAESDLVVSDGGWATLDEYNANRKQKKTITDFSENDRVTAGHLYLTTDKGERKSTGSYYTPDYIVNYIVKNTIGPVVEQKWKDAQEKSESCIDATLSINVLDPAMGSGHFLVGAVDFLSQKLLEAVQKDFESGKITDTAPYTNDWARRDVVSHCIYGVDLNELAVELAKVGLWLTTISRDKPLSFLDHRLKQGNSLIGARLTNLRYYPGKEPKERNQTELPTSISPRFIGHILAKIAELDAIEDNRLEDIIRKEKAFEEFKQLPEYQKAKGLANVYTATYFGNVIIPTEKKSSEALYQDLVWAIAGDEKEWQSKTWYPWFKQASTIAQEKSFFHWELEFPEIFFDAGKLRENPGWDAVIGNPPYVRQESLGPDFKNYIQNRFESYAGGADLYVYFIEQSHAILRQSGYFGVICSNKFIKANYGKKIREFIKHRTTILSIVDFGELPVFKEASTFPAIFILQNASPKEQMFYFVPIKRLNFTSLDDEIQKTKTILDSQALIGENWTLSNENEVKILERMKNKGIKLKEYSNGEIYRGLITGLTKVFIIDEKTKNQMIEEDQKNENLIKPFIIGDDIRRYQPSISSKYVILIPKGWTNEQSPDAKDKWHWFKENFPAISRYLEPFAELAEKRLDKGDYWWELRACEYYPVFEKPKIIYPNICRESRFTFDEQKFYLNNACYFIPIEDMYLLGLLNSKLIWLFLKRTCTCLGDPDKGGRLQLFDIYIRELPLRRISFTTPADRRTSIVNEAKELYLSFTQSTDPQQLLAFIDTRLAAQPEESDVVHDLLAFLAEQMVEMNKAKNAEIKAFLNFVESEIGASVDVLSNKTLIQEYYANDFTKIVDVLVKNKSKIKVGYNPKSPTNRKNLEAWHTDSCGKLKPLMTKIDATDTLIDQIVYKLYGLTAEEITVVEDSSGK